jgi:Xaa-Pro dipeptidase
MTGSLSSRKKFSCIRQLAYTCWLMLIFAPEQVKIVAGSEIMRLDGWSGPFVRMWPFTGAPKSRQCRKKSGPATLLAPTWISGGAACGNHSTAGPFAFKPAEFRQRIARAQEKITAIGNSGLVAVLPESVTYLTGYYTRGYSSFQVAIIPSSGDPVIVCRDVEAYHLERSSPFRERAVFWSDGEDPVEVAARAVSALLGASAQILLETDAWPLSAARFARLQALLPRMKIVDAGLLVAELRLIKSPAEVAYQRRAAAAAEAGMAAGIEAAVPGNTERDVAAAVCRAMVLAGSDAPGPGVLSSGEGALHLHGSYGDRVLRAADLVQLETTPNVRQYHARFMRPIKVGQPDDEDLTIVNALVAIQDRALAEVKAGAPAIDADRVYREGVLSAGLRTSYTNKTFYSVGLLLPPNSSEFLDATAKSTWCFLAGMVFHSYVLARGFGISETILVTDTGHEKLTRFPRSLFAGGSRVQLCFDDVALNGERDGNSSP